jgi:hypothetical protein
LYDAAHLLLIGSVAAVGVLHTLVPDHWVPITLIARQQGWGRAETARAALQAGTGHVLSTLLIAAVVWLAGVTAATRFGEIVDAVASVALILFGAWIALASLREMRGAHGHSHTHGHAHGHAPANGGDALHGPEREDIATEAGKLTLSIFEQGVPPRFRITGPTAQAFSVETSRDDGTRQFFSFINRGKFWESVDVIPEPHQFAASATMIRDQTSRSYAANFTEHAHPHADEHVHLHRHGDGPPHEHEHAHDRASLHLVTEELQAAPPLHEHRHRKTARTILLLILGSSPMVEGIPLFFAAGKYGAGLMVAMALVFAVATIATYVVLCVSSTAGLQRIRLGAFERYGEVLSGAFIALVGVVFLVWPIL